MSFLDFDINNTKLQIDHIDRCPTNNNINNLRIVTHQENQFNRDAIGATIDRNKWKASISINNIKKNLGRFNTKEEAHNAYLEAKAKYHIILPHPNPHLHQK